MKIRLLFITLTLLLVQACFLIDSAAISGSGGVISDNSSQDFAAVQTAGGLVYSLDSVVISGLQHSWAADLIITLTAPDGASSVLVQNDGSYYDFNGDYTFVSSEEYDIPSLYDYNGLEVYQDGVIIGQTLRAKGLLQNLKPADMAGEWILTIEDGRTGDSGSFASFTVNCTFFKPWW